MSSGIAFGLGFLSGMVALAVVLHLLRDVEEWVDNWEQWL